MSEIIVEITEPGLVVLTMNRPERLNALGMGMVEEMRSALTELDDDPDNWVRWYRVARAYDYAGDRSRAREAMKRAVLLEERQ